MHATPARITRIPLVRTLAVCLLAALVGGCQTTPTRTQSDVLGDYEQRRYAQAYDGAKDLAEHSKGDAKVQADYLAGLSAYQLGKDNEAIQYLSRVNRAADRSIAGPANATIGLAQSRLGRHEPAIAAFADAARILDGNDQAQAYYHQGVAEQKLGRWTSARTHLSLAVSKSTDADLRAAAAQRLDNTGFTLQFGAYGSQENAVARAREVYRQCEAAGVGPPRIANSKSPDGKTLYLVQAGRFSTFTSAVTSRTKLGRTDVLVTQLEN